MILDIYDSGRLEAPNLVDQLHQAINASRFQCASVKLGKTFTNRTRKQYRLKIEKVRLNISKHYCGNHPGACQVAGPHRTRKSNCLEGLDWVSFNSLVNDVLDTHRVKADVYTSDCILRVGTARRFCYEMTGSGNAAAWSKVGHLDRDYMVNPDPTFLVNLNIAPEGTPGLLSL